MEKNWTREAIEELLVNNEKAVLRAVVAIYNKQVELEKICEVTLLKNWKGYNHPDAKLMTIFAKDIIAGKKLSARQFAEAKSRIMKYAKQLAKIANKEI